MHWIRAWSMPKWVSSETFSKKDKIYKLHRLLPLHFFEVWRNINPELFNAMLMVKLFYLRKYLFTKFLSSFRVNWFLTATTVNIINKCNKYFPHCSPHLSLTIRLEINQAPDVFLGSFSEKYWEERSKTLATNIGLLID